MRIVVSNSVALNTGDAAILLGLVAILKEAFGPDTEFVVYDAQPDVAGRLHPGFAFARSLHVTLRTGGSGFVGRLRRKVARTRLTLAARAWAGGRPQLARGLVPHDLREALEDYGAADLVVSTGGTYLVEHYALAPRIADFDFTRRMGRPLVLFTQSLGPFEDPGNRRALAPLLGGARAILLRDARSLRHLHDLGAGVDRAHVGADAAFALADPARLASARDSAGAEGSLRVAISVRAWRHFAGDEHDGMRRYRLAIAALVAHLVEGHGADVLFVSTCQGVPEYWTDDSDTAAEIIALLSPAAREHVRVDRAYHDPATLGALLGRHDLVVATRMHAAILALSAGVPVLPIAYEFKTRELAARLGLSRWTQDVERLTGPGLVAACDDLLAELDDVRGELFCAVERERRSALGTAAVVQSAQAGVSLGGASRRRTTRRQTSSTSAQAAGEMSRSANR